MTGELQVMLLGGLRATFADAPAAGFQYKKSLALLAFLASTGQPQSRETLSGMLWTEMPEENARANLRKVLTDLRQCLAPYLIVTRQTVAINPERPCWLDTRAFEGKLKGLRTAGDHGLLSEGQIQELSQAVELYRGDFMEGFYIHDAPAFEEWVILQREHYRQLQLTALQVLTEHHTAQGAYAQGIIYAGQLLALEPWHEESHRQMMLLLAMSGQRSAALHQYEVCAAILKQELDVEPSRDTTELYSRIQAGEVDVASARATPPHNLFAPVTPFVGREAELHATLARLGDPQCRLLTLVGIAGVGKTRLALEAASATLGRFADGVFLVRAETANAADLVCCIADELGLCLKENESSEEQLLRHLHEKQILLVLDNAELLVGCERLLLEILHRAPKVKCMMTSLERLGLDGEWVLPIEGLAVPRSSLAGDIDSSSAVQLFAAYARRAEADFAIDDENRAAIARICQLVEGLPLAIELAAAWARVLSCHEIAREIENNIDFLATSSTSVPERHRSLRAVFAYSWAHLSPEEQQVFAQLSVFRGGFSRDAAEQVAGASLQLLASLLDRCLIQKGSLGRYEIHEFLREYGAEKLAGTPEQGEAVYSRHCRYFAALVAEKEIQLTGPRPQEALNEIAGELENIRVAQQWLARQAGIASPSSEAKGSPAPQTTHRRRLEIERLFEQTIGQAHALLEQRAGMAGEIVLSVQPLL